MNSTGLIPAFPHFLLKISILLFRNRQISSVRHQHIESFDSSDVFGIDKIAAVTSQELTRAGCFNGLYGCGNFKGIIIHMKDGVSAGSRALDPLYRIRLDVVISVIDPTEVNLLTKLCNGEIVMKNLVEMNRIDGVRFMLVIQIRYMDDPHPGLLFRISLNSAFTPGQMNDLIHLEVFTGGIVRGYRKREDDLAAGRAGDRMVYPSVAHRKG